MLVAQLIKNPFVNAGDTERWVQSLGWEDPLEKEMATRFSILTWKIPWTEEASRPQSILLQSRTQLSVYDTH